MKTIAVAVCCLFALVLFGAPSTSKDEKTVMVAGAVNHPGIVKVEGATIGLIEAIKKAEGLSRYADRNNVKVTSGGFDGPATFHDLDKIGVRTAAEPQLKPGDVVLVPQINL